MRTSPQHRVAAAWLEGLLQSGEDVAVPWVAVWAFIRIATSPKLWTRPLAVSDAFEIVREWLDAGKRILETRRTHLDFLERVLAETGIRGPRITDAVLAAIAIEHDATL